MAATLITGGCGFVGRNLVKDLLADGAGIICIIDDLSAGANPVTWLDAGLVDRPEDTVGKYETDAGAEIWILRTDVRVGLRKLPGAHWARHWGPFDDVYHLAARVGGRLTMDRRPLFIAENLAIDAAFFSWVAEHTDSIGRVLYMSSSATYPVEMQRFGGNAALHEALVDQHSGMGTDGVYGWSKLTGEFLARNVSAKAGIHVACVRPFSGYGPGQARSYPVTAIAERAIARVDPLPVWGPGVQQRDFLFVSDLVAGARRALDRISGGTAVNLGTGIGTTFREVAESLARCVGYSPTVVSDPAKPVGAEVRVADTELMAALLDWRPSVSLDTGLAHVVAELRSGPSDGSPATVSTVEDPA
ncbi:NAD-dependent epimerase/dehydratase family protein [Micromonospora sp. CPCC 206061]|uniref:NAD-dependent epimerase/dehydratase family protein n=1 Tax=Micromonospora sp. CPCC 206061 TaxID=3122410 RepID=UPI002FF3957D